MLAIAAAVLVAIAQAWTVRAAVEKATAASRKTATALEARAQADDAAEEALAELDRVRAQTAEQLAAYQTASEQAQAAAHAARTELAEVRAAAAASAIVAQEAATQEAPETATHQAIADVEPDQATVVQQRAQAGLTAARPRGLPGHRTPRMTPELIDKAQRMYDSRRFTVAEIAQSCAVSPTTIYRHIRTGRTTMH